MGDLFLVEKGQFVVIRRDENEVVFESLAEYQEHSGIDLTGKTYVCYQTDGDFHIDKSEVSGLITTPFETIILDELEKIDQYKAQKADPYFGKSLEESKEIKKRILQMEVEAYIAQSYPTLTQTVMIGLHMNPTTPSGVKTNIVSVLSWIQNVMKWFYGIKTDIDTDFNTTWDISSNDATNPNIDLGNLV